MSAVTEFKTHWHGSVSVDGVVKVSSCNNDLSKLLEFLIRDAVYYQAVYPAGRVLIKDLVQKCRTCDGDGEVLVKGKRARVFGRKKACPECRGKPPFGAVRVMLPVEFRMPDQANGIRLAYDQAERRPPRTEEELREAIVRESSTIKGRFLLSGYRSALYDAHASLMGWTRHEKKINNHAAGGKTKRIMTECVWTNF